NRSASRRFKGGPFVSFLKAVSEALYRDAPDPFGRGLARYDVPLLINCGDRFIEAFLWSVAPTRIGRWLRLSRDNPGRSADGELVLHQSLHERVAMSALQIQQSLYARNLAKCRF